MDISKSPAPRRLWRRAAAAALSLGAIAGVTLGLSRLTAAVPALDRTSVWIDTVKRGPMLRQVRGVGTLVPEETRWIPATTSGRVERIQVRPGTVVEDDTVILELSNPTLQQELEEATLRLQATEAALTSLRADLVNEALAQEAATASIEADYQKAALQVRVNEQLAARALVSPILVEQATLDARQLEARLAIARKQLVGRTDSSSSRLAVRQADIDQARAIMLLRRRQVDDLRVRAGAPGVLQLVPVEVGQQVSPGTNLARVADPTRLKAELKVAETQARDIQLDQPTAIDTRNGIIAGRVSRIDPAVQNGTVTVDVALQGPLPRGARPDLTIDGTVELERLADVLFVGRPAVGQTGSAVGLFRLLPDGRDARRVMVTLGRSSVNTVEVIDGLAEGDRVILSDMSSWDAFERVRLR